MESFESSADQKNSTFWKKNVKAVPGRPSPRKEVKTSEFVPSTSASYQDFQKSVSDAWDLGDDEFCNISGMRLSKKGSPGMDNVINIHKTRLLNTEFRDSELKCPFSEDVRGSGEVDEAKVKRFRSFMESPFLNLKELQNLSWPGIPFPVKADCWRLLAGYASPSLESRADCLSKKREEYWGFVQQYYKSETRDEAYQSTYRQIQIDIPRMSPNIGLFRQKTVQDTFERILFVWSVRHPASGYVQGINDLVTPFYVVFLHSAVSDRRCGEFDVSRLSQSQRDDIEADSYWCFCKFLDGIQENYIFPQLGIQHKINQLKELIQRIDANLHNHLSSNGVEYLQFSFRWMNNLLTRELPLRCLVRLWDTYLSELETFSSFQLFVCAAFLLYWKEELMLKKDFQSLMLMLQNLPTKDWTDSHVSLLVAEAYRLKFTFADAPNHFQTQNR